jgi:hypothetical protein
MWYCRIRVNGSLVDCQLRARPTVEIRQPRFKLRNLEMLSDVICPEKWTAYICATSTGREMWEQILRSRPITKDFVQVIPGHGGTATAAWCLAERLEQRWFVEPPCLEPP